MVRFWLAFISGPPGTIESVGALLTQRSKHPIETVCVSYFPRPNSQPQRTRRGWENLFQLEYIVRSGRIVENRDTGNFRNGFFEQLQPFPA